MIDEEEFKRWEECARKDNPSYWSSKTLLEVFLELRKAQERIKELESDLVPRFKIKKEPKNEVRKGQKKAKNSAT